MGRDVTKKFKGLDGYAVPVSYISSKGKSGQLVHEAPNSFEENEDGSTSGADGNTRADHHMQGEKGSEGMRSADTGVKVHHQAHLNGEGDRNTASTDPVQVPIGSSYESIGTSTAFFSPSAGERFPFDAMVLNEKQLKREKRKQANRESARRSRMRKQAEYEELLKSCDSLSTEQMDLKSELDQLKVEAEKLRLENAALKEQLKNALVVQEGGIASPKTEGDFTLPNDAKDILSNLVLSVMLSWIARHMKLLSQKQLPGSISCWNQALGLMLLLLDEQKAVSACQHTRTPGLLSSSH